MNSIQIATTGWPKGQNIARVEIVFADGSVRQLSAAEVSRLTGAVGWSPADKAAAGDMRKAAVSAVGDAESALRAAEQERDPRAKILLQKRATDMVAKAATMVALAHPVPIETLAR